MCCRNLIYYIVNMNIYNSEVCYIKQKCKPPKINLLKTWYHTVKNGSTERKW